MSGRRPRKPGREKSAFEVWDELMGDKEHLCYADVLDPALFEQPWNPAPAIDEWLEMMESGEYPAHFCLRMVRDTARWALEFLARARRGEKLDYSRFELFHGELGSRAETELGRELGALVRTMQARDSFEAMQPELERVLVICEAFL